jgi:uncharacterized protein (TIGR03067 family)
MEKPHPLPKIEGNWQVVRAELGGQPMPADAAEHVELRFTAESYHVSFGGEVTDEGRYLLTQSSSHTHIEMIGEQGVNVGKTIPGILQLAGDSLRVCYALESESPPTEFTAPAGQLQYLATYRRKA